MTHTPTITRTITATATLTGTNTPQAVLTVTHTRTATATATPTLTQTPYVTPTATMTPTLIQVHRQLLMSITGVFPNPAVDGANLVFWLSKEAVVTIKVYDVSGEVVAVREAMQCQEGHNSWYWDRKNRADKGAASGVFILKADAVSGDEKVTAYTKAAVVK